MKCMTSQTVELIKKYANTNMCPTTIWSMHHKHINIRTQKLKTNDTGMTVLKISHQRFAKLYQYCTWPWSHNNYVLFCWSFKFKQKNYMTYLVSTSYKLPWMKFSAFLNKASVNKYFRNWIILQISHNQAVAFQLDTSDIQEMGSSESGPSSWSISSICSS